jgi:hypothetical protein
MEPEPMPDDPRERVTYIDRGGGGFGALMVGIAVLAVVAIIAFFVLQQSRNDSIRTDSITHAADSVAGSAGTAASRVGDAADRAAGAAAAH